MGLENGYRKYILTNTEAKSLVYDLPGKPPTNLMVWDYLIKNMCDMNKILVIQTELSVKLGIHRASVVRALKKLEETGRIVKYEKSQLNNIYMVNPYYHWKGNSKKMNAGMSIFMRLQVSKQSKGKKPKTL